MSHKQSLPAQPSNKPSTSIESKVSSGTSFVVELDEEGLIECARTLGRSLSGGEVLLMFAQMGAGKTTFARGLGEGLPVERPERVCSPTYTLCEIHPGRLELFHIDLYRLAEGDAQVDPAGTQKWDLERGSAGFESLGLDYEDLPGESGVMLVEWAELWSDPPQDHLRIEIDFPGELRGATRLIKVFSTGPRSEGTLQEWSKNFPDFQELLGRSGPNAAV